jgi:2-dehydropantoate 2-reductase
VWRDLAIRKRRTEVDPIMTVITEIGRVRGVETPLLDRLVALLKDVEDGRRDQSPATFAALRGEIS